MTLNDTVDNFVDSMPRRLRTLSSRDDLTFGRSHPARTLKLKRAISGNHQRQQTLDYNKPGSFAQWMDVRAACRITGNHVKRDEKESSFSYTCEPPIGHITGTVQLRTDNG